VFLISFSKLTLGLNCKSLSRRVNKLITILLTQKSNPVRERALRQQERNRMKFCLRREVSVKEFALFNNSKLNFAAAVLPSLSETWAHFSLLSLPPFSSHHQKQEQRKYTWAELEALRNIKPGIRSLQHKDPFLSADEKTVYVSQSAAMLRANPSFTPKWIVS